MEHFNLIQGDCLKLMKDIPKGSIDLILCDLPYGVTQNSKAASERCEASYRKADCPFGMAY